MPVRLGGSYLVDPVTGDLLPNMPADPASDTHSEARAGGKAEGQSAKPEPVEGAPVPDEPVANLTEPAPVPAPETGQASEVAPAAASDADKKSSPRRNGGKKDV